MRRASRLPERARVGASAIAALAVIFAVAACGVVEQRGVTVPAPPGHGSAPSAQSSGAPSAAHDFFTLLDGTKVRLSALRGQPTLVWFVANGCASCAVSIPAVARHLAAFARARTRVLVLGIYGAFALDSRGQVVYRNSVPVCTMGALLAHLGGHGSQRAAARERSR